MRDYKVGDRIVVRRHYSLPGRGLTYPDFSGVLLDPAGTSQGWDVVAIQLDHGPEVSIYCFSIER